MANHHARVPGWYVFWCSSPCAGNPHKTREEAEAWLERLQQSRIAAKAPMYGHYEVVEVCAADPAQEVKP